MFLAGEVTRVGPSSRPPHGPSDTRWPTIPAYQIELELGRGTMGVVYRARNLRLDRVVALKMILAGGHAGAADQARFLDEARAVARLQHPNIVQVFEVGEADGLPFCALEYVSGGTLAGVLKNEPQEPPAAAALVRVFARAMNAVHVAGLIHRDLKPANILIATDGTPKITDFGLAKRLDDSSGRTQDGQVMGTPTYMSPEQAAGEITRIGKASDIWALGAILYEMLTGRPPFRGTGVWDTIAQVLTQDPVPVRRLQPRCPRDLETVCHKCLEKSPEKRYSTAAAMADDLDRYLDGRPVLARRAGPAERAFKWARRSPLQAALGMVAAVCLVMFVAVVLLQARADRQDADLIRRDMAEDRRRGEVRNTLDELIAKAQGDADLAAWDRVIQSLESALKLADRDQEASDGWPLRESADALLTRAKAAQADKARADQMREAEQARFSQLRDLHSDAVFYGPLATSLGLDDDGPARARRAVAEGLALFQVAPEGDGPPVTGQGLLSPDEVRAVTNRCYELLLLDADTLVRADVGESRGVLRERVEEALTRLDRADRLLTGKRTRSSLVRRAEYLAILGREAESAETTEAAKAIAPILAADHFLIGLEHYRQDDFDNAAKSLDRALLAEPAHSGAQYLMAVCRYRQGQLEDAKGRLARCLELQRGAVWPQLFSALVEMELVRRGIGDYAVAQEHLDAVLQSHPDKVAQYVALTSRWYLAYSRRDWHTAIADLSEARDLRPNALRSYIYLALTHRQRADDPPWQADLLAAAPLPLGAVALVGARVGHRARALDEAVLVLDTAIHLRPTESRLFHERAQVHLFRQDSAGAQADLTQAIRLAKNLGRRSPVSKDLLELGRVLQIRKEFATAARVYEAVLKPEVQASGEQRALAARRRAQSLLALGQWKEAGVAYDEYLALVPTAGGQTFTPELARQVSEALGDRGLIYASQNNMRAAAECYTRGLGLVRSPQLLARRGWAYLATGAVSLAEQDFDEALRCRPGDADALIGRADAKAQLGRMQEAVTDAEEALRNLPKDTDPEERHRLRFNAARVFAQTATRATDPSKAVARTVGLLRAIRADLSPGKWPEFWKNVVLADPALARISVSPDMQALAAEAVVSGR
jgi:tetratricopeptide (TPR) repeat protein